MNKNAKRYTLEFGGAMAAYSVLVPVSIWLLRREEDSPLKYLFAALPVLPSLLAMWAALRFFRGLDELQRRIQFEGVAFSFLGTTLVTLTWGFLQNAGLPRADVIWVAPLAIVLWGIGLGVASRRYQ